MRRIVINLNTFCKGLCSSSEYLLKQWNVKNISQSFMNKEKYSGPHATGKNQA